MGTVKGLKALSLPLLVLCLGPLAGAESAIVEAAGADAAGKGDRGAAIVVRLSTEASGAAALSREDERPLLAAPAGSYGLAFSLLRGPWVIARAGLGGFGVSASGHDENLFSYRGYSGLYANLATGLSLPLGFAEVQAVVGGGLKASLYSKTSLVSVFPQATAELRLVAPLGIRGMESFSLDFAVPFAYSFRGGARTIEAGLSLGASVELGKGGRR